MIHMRNFAGQSPQDYLFVAPQGKALPAEEFREKKGTVQIMGSDGFSYDMPGQGANGSSKKGSDAGIGPEIGKQVKLLKDLGIA